MASSTQVTSSRLLKLPAELRNAIYELVFTTGHNDTKRIDLTTTHPPSKSLLMTCRQLYYETCQIYKDRYQNFWSQGEFVLDLDHPQAAERYAAQHVEDIEQISRLQVSRQSATWDLLDRRGGWRFSYIGHRWMVYYGWNDDGRWCGRFQLTEAQMEECYGQSMEGVPLYNLVKETWKIGH